jgi:hypothetical protein
VGDPTGKSTDIVVTHLAECARCRAIAPMLDNHADDAVSQTRTIEDHGHNRSYDE